MTDTNSQAGSSRSSVVPASQPCRYYFRSGTCKRKDKCKFSHELRREPGQPGTVPRTTIEESHPSHLSAQANEFVPTAASLSRLSAKAETFKPSITSLQDDDGWQDEAQDPQSSASISNKTASKLNVTTEMCNICMDIPEVYLQFPNCDHLFCPTCVREWRRQRNMANRKDCPTCRTPSGYAFATPQPFLGRARILAVKRFEQRAASIPCKTFTKSLNLSNKRNKPFCRFGDDCLFKHEMDGQPYEFGVGTFQICAHKTGRHRLIRPKQPGSRSSLRRQQQEISGSNRAEALQYFLEMRELRRSFRSMLATRIILRTRAESPPAEI